MSKRIGALIIIIMSTCCVAAAQGRNFGASYMTMNDTFFEAINSAIKMSVEANGDNLITLDPERDSQKQSAQIRELISKGVDAIFLSPVDWQEITPALLECKAAGIPVINVHNPVHDEEYVDCILESDNLSAGFICGEDLLLRLNGGKIAVLENRASKSGIDRIAKFEELIRKYPEFAIVARGDSEGDRETAAIVTGIILARNPDISAIMCVDDVTALGAIEALQTSDKFKGVLVYGIDGSPDAKKMIKEGLMTATAAQFPINIGVVAAQMAYRILNGQAFRKRILVPVLLITPENVNQFSVNSWQ